MRRRQNALYVSIIWNWTVIVFLGGQILLQFLVPSGTILNFHHVEVYEKALQSLLMETRQATQACLSPNVCGIAG